MFIQENDGGVDGWSWSSATEDMWDRALRFVDFEIDDRLGLNDGAPVSSQYSQPAFDYPVGTQRQQTLGFDVDLNSPAGYAIVGVTALIVGLIAYKVIK